jgi:hypothetical protein
MGWARCPASQPAITVVSRSASSAYSNRRIIASDGRRCARIPNRCATAAGRSATHSPIAVYEREPATTAHTAAASTVTSRCRTPRRARGSGTCANTASSPDGGTCPPQVAGAADNDEISDDGSAGMALFQTDQGVGTSMIF